MITSVVQRSASDGTRRQRYKPSGTRIDPKDYEVAPIDESLAKAFVHEHHYSGSYPAARFRFGLFKTRGDVGCETHRQRVTASLAGVAVFSHPCSDKVLTNALPISKATDGVELGRLVLLDSVAGDGESWFLARCFELLRREADLAGVVSFSDPFPRTDIDGAAVFAGHIGVIYQAHNAIYTGRGTARTLRLLADGSVLSDRAIQKVRKLERGYDHVKLQFVHAGAPTIALSSATEAERRDWLKNALALTTRTVRHPGNHRYVWGLHKAAKRQLPDFLTKRGTPSLPYPRSPFDGGV